jgi:hypothetical protein
MSQTWVARWAVQLLMGFALLLAQSAANAAPAHCDRSCMRKVLDSYLAAVFKHDPAAAPLATGAHSTENAVTLENGSGVWRTISGYGSVERRYFDTTNGEAGYFGTLLEGADTDIVSLRLKIEKRRVTEAEWTVARSNAGGMFSIDGLTSQPPPPDHELPAAKPTPRAKMIAAANAYFDGLQQHDGANVPHVDGCERIENGVKVTNRILPRSPGGNGATPPAASDPTVPGLIQEAPGATGSNGAPALAQEAKSGDCAAGFDMFKNSILETVHRRFPLVDEQAGVVLGSTLFHRPLNSKLKRNLLTEYFYVDQGRIGAIYAAMFYLDPSAPDTPGW